MLNFHACHVREKRDGCISCSYGCTCGHGSNVGKADMDRLDVTHGLCLGPPRQLRSGPVEEG